MGKALTQVLRVSLLLPLQVHQAVAHPELRAALGTPRYLHRLAVDDQQVARGGCLASTWIPWLSGGPWTSW